MSLTRVLLRQSRAALVLAAALVVAGIVAALTLPSSIYPPLEFPRIVLIAKSGTLPSQSTMLTLTQPIEQAIMEVPGIRRVRSTSLRGAAEISAQFDSSTDMVLALQQVQNRVAEIRGELPADTDLTIERLTPAVFPVFILSLTGPLPTAQLDDYGRFVIRPALARIPGAGHIDVLSSDTREIEVVLDPVKLTAAGLTVPDVADALAAQNQVVPVGRYAEGGQQNLSLASGLWTSVDQIANAVVRAEAGATIRVRDVGDVHPGSPDRTLLVTGGGRDAVSIGITQQIGANILAIQHALDDTLARLATTLPSGLTFTRVYDLAEFVRSAIANVRDAILIGGLLAVIVLLVFLRDIRLTVIAAVTLPLAVIPTFAVLKLFGGSINLMSMGGLAVAIGLVIDDAVVVVENIHRRAFEGADGVMDAVSELMGPLVSSTLTTVVVFAPLGLLSGVPGQFFRALSLSLSAAVLLSLAWSVSVVPVLARWAMRHGSHAVGEVQGTRLDRAYGRLLSLVLRRPSVAVVAAVMLAAATLVSFRMVGTGFLPPADEGGFVIDYLTPAGTALEETDRQVRAMERVVASVPEVASYMRRTGSELGLFATPPNSGDIVVRLKPRGERQRSSDEVIADLRPKLVDAAPAAEIEFVLLLQDMLGDLEGNSTPIEVKIFGDDSNVLAQVAQPVQELLEGLDGVVDVVGMQQGNPEVTWEIDPAAAGRYGLTTAQVGAQLSAAWLGAVATDLRLLDRRLPVRVRLPDDVRFNPLALSSTLLRGGSGALVPLAALARPERSNGQAQLMRENLRQMALVTARLEGRDLGSAVAEIREGLTKLPLPVGYTYELGGQYDSQRQAFRELLLVFGTAVTLVFMILVVQFGEFGSALLVILAAPLSAVGALGLLMATGVDLNVSSAMGLILLVGLVVKNGIMLIDYTGRLRARGEPWAAAVAHAGRVRLRPILMTTFCTVFGLLPLALGLGAGAELQRPLALAVIGGLALSTPITLLVLPGLYTALARRRA